jgi:hypothetical protein
MNLLSVQAALGWAAVTFAIVCLDGAVDRHATDLIVHDELPFGSRRGKFPGLKVSDWCPKSRAD